MTGVEERWNKHPILNISIIKHSVFAQSPANKVLENQAKEKEFIEDAQPVQWRQNHGIKK